VVYSRIDPLSMRREPVLPNSINYQNNISLQSEDIKAVKYVG